MTVPRALAPWLLPPAALVVALTATYLAGGFGAPTPVPAEIVGLFLAATLAALHRPARGGVLGLGTLVVLPAIARLGAPLAALLLVLAATVAESLRRILERRRRDVPLPERRHPTRVLAQVSLAGLGALAAAGARLIGPTESVFLEPVALLTLAAIPALAFVAPAALFEVITRRRRRDEGWRSILSGLAPLAGELPGFALGALILAVADRAGWPLAAASLGGAALLACEAARQALGAEAAERSLAESRKVSLAGASLVTGGSELERLARRIFAECAAIVPFAFAELELRSPESGVARFWTAEDLEPREGEPDPPAYPPPLPGFHRREPWRIVERALLDEEERRARLRFWCDPRRIEPTAEASLAGLEPQMAASVRAALLDREATTDRLTGAATRRALERRLTEAFAASRERGGSLAVVLADLDHFKRINDAHGHAVGDLALREVARILIGPDRGRDFCARYGGEEFVLVLEQANGEIALEVAERLRRRIEEAIVEVPGGALELTMSFGVAATPELPVRSAEELLELADGALYTAKRLGRNLALLDLGGGRMRTGTGGEVAVSEPPPVEAPVFFA